MTFMTFINLAHCDTWGWFGNNFGRCDTFLARLGSLSYNFGWLELVLVFSITPKQKYKATNFQELRLKKTTIWEKRRCSCRQKKI